MHSPETGLQVAPPQLQTFLQCFPQNPFWQATAEKEKKEKTTLLIYDRFSGNHIQLTTESVCFLDILNILESSDKNFNFNAC